VRECETRFVKKCYIEYEHRAAKRAVNQCLREVDRLCGYKTGPKVCSNEKEMGKSNDQRMEKYVIFNQVIYGASCFAC